MPAKPMQGYTNRYEKPNYIEFVVDVIDGLAITVYMGWGGKIRTSSRPATDFDRETWTLVVDYNGE